MKSIAVAPQPRAAEEAASVLIQGGNAVDAAVSAALVQGIIDPLNCGIGGLGWMHIYNAERNEDFILDFCSKAGSRATPDMWEDHILGPSADGVGYILKDDVNEIGYQSVGIPTSVRGLNEAITRYGTRGWAETIASAVTLAREGYHVPRELADEWRIKYSLGRPDALARFTTTPAAAAIYTKEGKPLVDGELLVNHDYADSLELIATDGPLAYYSGTIGKRLVEDWSDNGGLVTEDDLATYQVEIQNPLRGTYRGFTVSDTPPPSGGITLIEVLNILEGYDLSSMGHNTSEYIHVLSQALKAGFVDRAKYLGDPEFIDIPVDMLISKEHAANWRTLIDRGEDFNVASTHSTNDSGTTHLSIVDNTGNCVSLTHTNGLCSGVVTPGLGFLQNNYMLAFDPMPGNPNSIEPGKKRTTSALPCMVFKKDRPFMVVGAPGGSFIISSVLQTILNVIDHRMTAVEAVSAPRIDCQGNTLYLEGRIPYWVCDELVDRGHNVYRDSSSYGVYPRQAARVQAIVLDEAGGTSAGSDPRGYGMAFIV